MEKIDSIAAFPYTFSPGGGGGMNLRDYFAAHCINSIIASSQYQTKQEAVDRAFAIADMMMEQREKVTS